MARFYVTTPIYYVNDAPHIGHAYTTVIADAVARWHRLLGDDVFFLTGTDEHGLKVQRAAEANGVSPRQWADQTVVRFQDAWKLLDINSDDFIRTTEPRHYRAVEKLLQACYEAGDIELSPYKGFYSVADEEYISADKALAHVAEPHPRLTQMRDVLAWFEARLSEWNSPEPSPPRPVS